MDSISSLKLADLKRELKARSLPITGTKQILVDRLVEAMSAEKPAADDSNIDDLLDEDSMLGEEESDAGSDENVVAADLTISSPTATVPPTSLPSPSKTPEAIKRSASSPLKGDQNGTSSANKDGPPPSKKKIILNREPIPEEAPPVLPAVTAEAIAASKAVSDTKRVSTDSTGEKAVIKLSEVTAAPITDKLKLRQEKFKAAAAATPEVADKLKKRSDRFGVVAPVSVAAGKVSLTAEDEVKLARRRERFGLPADTKTDEMKVKRAERFGFGASKATPENAAEIEEKKKLRAARFAAAL